MQAIQMAAALATTLSTSFCALEWDGFATRPLLVSSAIPPTLPLAPSLSPIAHRLMLACFPRRSRT